MSFARMRERVLRAERLLEGRERQAGEQWSALATTWRRAWTPWRIVVAGVGLGFFAGRAEPVAAIGGLAGRLGGAPKLLDMIGAVSGLVGLFQAQDAEADADAPDTPAPTPAPAGPPASAGRDPGAAPRPAEAATELSERD